MGLDMYLKRRKSDGTLSKTDLGYWRKDYAVFHWFEKNLDSVKNQPYPKDEVDREMLEDGQRELESTIFNCEQYEVKKEELELLLKECRRIVKIFEDDGSLVPEEIGDLNPYDHWYLDSSDFDEGYVEDLKDTSKIIESVLSPDNVDWENETVVFYAWW